MKPSEVTIDKNLKRVELRVFDHVIENKIFNRHIFEQGKYPVPPRPCSASFIEPIDFNKYGDDLKGFHPRIVPYYTKAIESVYHLLIPRMNKLGYSVDVSHAPQFISVNVYEGLNPEAISNCIHTNKAIAIVTACLKTLKIDDSIYERVEKRIRKP